MIAVAYTDASFDHRLDIAACGVYILVDGIPQNQFIHLISEVGSSAKAEIYAVVQAIQHCFLLKGVDSIEINTDLLSIITRKKLKTKYAELDETIEMCKEQGIFVTINHVKGHAGNKHNNLVDKNCRAELKKLINASQKSKSQTPGTKRRT